MASHDRAPQWGSVAAVALVVWLVLFLTPGSLTRLGSFDRTGFSPVVELFVVAWLLVPVSLYCDIQYVRASGDWDPSTALWVGASTVWLLNVLVGLGYLLRRRGSVGFSPPSRPADLVPDPPPVTSRWWYWIALQPPFLVVYLVTMRWSGVGDVETTAALLSVLVVAGAVALGLLFPLALYLDARALSDAGVGWRPNPYLYGGLGAVLPNLGYASGANATDLYVLGMGLAAAVAVGYLGRRRRSVGTP